MKALDISTEDLFAADHIKESEELINQIYNILDTVKNDNKKLEKIYKMAKFLANED